MGNVKPVTKCPQCQEIGVVVGHTRSLIKLECPSCTQTWNTLSKLCRDCGKPNWYFVDGPCIKCYSEMYKSS